LHFYNKKKYFKNRSTKEEEGDTTQDALFIPLIQIFLKVSHLPSMITTKFDI